MSSRRIRAAILTVVLLSLMAFSTVHAADDQTMTNQEPMEFSSVVEANTQFAFDLFQTITSTDLESNQLFSPYSISQALAMAYAGAGGSTAEEMAQVLGFEQSGADLAPLMAALNRDLTEREYSIPVMEEDEEPQTFQLNVANALWGRQDFPFAPAYLELLDAAYGAGLELVDFVTEPEDARVRINDWVAENTEDRIKDIVPPGAITPMTRLVLANAIYFNAAWANPFVDALTQDETFFLLDDSTVTVPMMQQEDTMRFTSGDGYSAVEIPYLGFDVTMIVMLPDEGNFEAFQSSLDAETFNALAADLTSGGGDVRLLMPRFEYETSVPLTRALVEMGMAEAFSESADFSNMVADGGESLFISEALHKAFIKVDEEGTEAAAATVLMMEATSMPMPGSVVEIRVDRPFIYAIYDRVTGTVLFLGRVMDPTA